MPKTKTPMSPAAAARIQRQSDRTGTNAGFKSRAQSAASKNTTSPSSGGSKGGNRNNSNRGKK